MRPLQGGSPKPSPASLWLRLKKPDEAFQKLVRVSQNANIKLREIAQRYVSAWEEKTQGGTKIG